MGCYNCLDPVHILQLVKRKNFFQILILFLCLAKEIWYTFYLHLKLHHLPPVPNWKDHNSKKWRGEEGIHIKQCVQCTIYVTKNHNSESNLSPFFHCTCQDLLLQVMLTLIFWYQKLTTVLAIVRTSKQEANGLL